MGGVPDPPFNFTARLFFPGAVAPMQVRYEAGWAEEPVSIKVNCKYL
jgi:hypothetical protein